MHRSLTRRDTVAAGVAYGINRGLNYPARRAITDTDDRSKDLVGYQRSHSCRRLPASEGGRAGSNPAGAPFLTSQSHCK